MRMFLNFQFFYCKQLIKDPFYIGTNIFMLIMLLLRFIINSNSNYDYMDYGNFVGEMSLIIQALILCFIVFFYNFFSNEYKFGAGQLFIGSFKNTLLKIAALLMNHLITLLVFTSIQVGMIFSYFTLSEIEFSYFYIDTAVYILYYWFLPSFLAFLIGIFLALSFGKKNITYIIIIVIWICIGPLNTSLFSSFFSSLSESDFGYLFLLSPLNNSDVYRDIIGYNLNSSILFTNLVWILFISSLIVLSLIKSTRTQRDKWILLITTAVLLIMSIGIIPYALKERVVVFDYNKILKEAQYSEKQSPVIYDKYLSYEIEKYNISINVKSKVEANVEMQLKILNKDVQTIAFSIYHSMNIKRVTNINGNTLSFSQIGDFVFVNQPTSTLVFHYTMNDSALLPVSEKYLYLPSYLNWVPKKSKLSQLIYDETIQEEKILISNPELAEYYLKFNGKMPIYTNLNKNKNNNNEYTSKQISGVSLIGGAIKKNYIENNFLVYPQSWSDVSNEWLKYKKALNKTHHYLTDMFNLNDIRIPKDIIFLTPLPKYDSFMNSNQLFIQHATLYKPSSSVHEIPEVYTPGFLWNNIQTANIDPGLIEVFNELLNSLLLAEINYDTPISYGTEFDLSPLDPLSRYNDIESLGISNFYKNYSDMDLKEKKEFLVRWYNHFSEIKNWDKAIIFMNSFKKEINS